MSSAVASFNFRVWGKVVAIDGDSLTLDDGSGMPVKVVAPGFTNILLNDYVLAKGKFSGAGESLVLNALANNIIKY
jgi:hypothetical protein